MLAMFESRADMGLFVSRLIVAPAALMLVYTVAIVIQGASWLWIPIALLGSVGAFFASFRWSFGKVWATFPKWKSWLWVLLAQYGDTAATACWSAIWVRLVIVSGLYGLYQSLWVRLEGFGIFAALLSLVLGYFFSKQLNGFFFFVLQYTRRRQFRAGLAPGRPEGASLPVRILGKMVLVAVHRPGVVCGVVAGILSIVALLYDTDPLPCIAGAITGVVVVWLYERRKR